MPRTVSASLFISLDGVVETPEDWSLSYWSDEIQQAMAGGMFDADALLLGRVTYEHFAASWGGRVDADDPGTEHMNSVRKYVASRTLSRADWNNSVVLDGDLRDSVTALKNEDGGDIAVSGSPTLVRSLLDLDLLDELRLLIYPVALGKGKQLLTGTERKHTLTLASATALSNGVIHAVYRVPADR